MSVNDRTRNSYWTFTFNYGLDGQPDQDEAETTIRRIYTDLGRYVVFGREEAPTSGQPHLQGYLQVQSPVRRSELSRYDRRVHWEKAVADELINREYCLKIIDGVQHNLDFEEWGTPVATHAGIREQCRWTLARNAAMSGDLDAIPDQIFVQHYSSIRAIARDHLSLPSDATDVTGVWYYGPSGCGKSRSARQDYGTDPKQLYLKPLNKWWDGYRGQPYVLLEDFGKEHSCLGYHLKIWADRYAFPAEIKSSTISLRPQTIVVTSQYHPREVFLDAETLEAILRRFRLVWKGPLPNPYEGLPMHQLLPSPRTEPGPSVRTVANDTRPLFTSLPVNAHVFPSSTSLPVSAQSKTPSTLLPTTLNPTFQKYIDEFYSTCAPDENSRRNTMDIV